MTSRRATPDDGQPSADARTRLAADLRVQLATSQLEWEAALLHSDLALARGDGDEVRAALDEHRRLLGSLEERLGAAVAVATTARDDEELTRGRTSRAATGSRGRRAVSALLGAAAVLLVGGLVVSELPSAPDGSMARAPGEAREDLVGEDATSDDVAATTPGGTPPTGPPTTVAPEVSPEPPVDLPSPPRATPPPVPTAPRVTTDGPDRTDDRGDGGHDRPGEMPTQASPPVDVGPLLDVPGAVEEGTGRLEGAPEGPGEHRSRAGVDLSSSSPSAVAEAVGGSLRDLVDPLVDAHTPVPASDPDTGLR